MGIKSKDTAKAKSREGRISCFSCFSVFFAPGDHSLLRPAQGLAIWPNLEHKVV